MKPTRFIHAITDLCLGTMVGVSVGASVAAWTIFSVSRESGFDKHIANTLAGSMFDRLGWPMFGLSLLAAAGCLFAAKQPPLPSVPTPRGRRVWQIMAAASVLIVACAAATQLHFAPRMKELRESATWVNGELADPAQKAEFGRTHGLSFGVAGLATLLAAGLVVARRVAGARAPGP